MLGRGRRHRGVVVVPFLVVIEFVLQLSLRLNLVREEL